jgi:hypothetical protein
LKGQESDMFFLTITSNLGGHMAFAFQGTFCWGNRFSNPSISAVFELKIEEVL